jgi:hypothetical protein
MVDARTYETVTTTAPLKVVIDPQKYAISVESSGNRWSQVSSIKFVNRK